MPTVILTAEKFIEEVFDYKEENQDWKFLGDKPAIIDFYADWCGPCKALSPILEELSNEFADDIVIYKVDTEAEQELSAMFSIRSIPSMLFISMDKKPVMQTGALPKNILIETINKELLGKQNA